MIEASFGNLLEIYRKQKKLKIETLAELSGVSSSYISLLIRGKKGSPSDQIIEQLARALELTEDQKLEFQAAAQASKANGSPLKLEQYLSRQSPKEAGLVAVHPSLTHSLLREHFLKARELIRIQDNGLQDLLTYNNLFREMLKTKRPDLIIQILLLDPDPKSSLVNLREESLSMPQEMGYLRQQIDNTIKVFRGIHEDFERINIEMRLYKVLPSVQHIAFDNTIFIGFYCHTMPSQSGYQLQILRGTGLGNFFDDDFEKVWSRATQVRL